MMKFTNTFMLLAVCVTTTAAVEDEKLPLRRLRQQTLHIPDLFEMSTDKNEKNEWYDAKAASTSSQNLMNSRRRNAALSEMDVFARLLQSDSSLSLSMPTAPTPIVPTPMFVPTPMVVPTPPAPVTPPTAPVVPPPAPTILAPTPPAPVATSCPVYPVCASLGLIGECCPTTEGIFLDCCSGIVPAPNSSPVTAPSGPGTIEPAPTPGVVPTPTSKSKEGMSKVSSPSSKTGSMSSVESPTSSMSSSKGPSSSMSGSMSPTSSMSSSSSKSA